MSDSTATASTAIIRPAPHRRRHQPMGRSPARSPVRLLAHFLFFSSMGFGTSSGSGPGPGKRKSEETGRNISIEGVEVLNNPFHAAALGGKAPSDDRTTSSGSSPGDVIDFMNRASLADKTAKPHDLKVNMEDEVTQAEASRAARSRGRSPSPVSSKLGFFRGRSPRGTRRPPSPTNAPPVNRTTAGRRAS